MKKILLSLAAVAALGAAAAPAAAQDWRDHGRYDDHHRHGGRLDVAYVDGLDWKITNAAREGRISWGEARELRNDLRQVRPIAWRVQTGRARGWEVERLQRTVNRIEASVSGYRYGRNDRDDRHDWR